MLRPRTRSRPRLPRDNVERSQRRCGTAQVSLGVGLAIAQRMKVDAHVIHYIKSDQYHDLTTATFEVSEADTGSDFGVVVVAYDEHLVRLESVVVENILEDFLLPSMPRLVDGIDVDRRE